MFTMMTQKNFITI